MTKEPITRLDAFMVENSIPVEALLRACGRSYAWKLRKGMADPSLSVALGIVASLSEAIGRPVGLGEAFDLTPKLNRPAKLMTTKKSGKGRR